METFNNEDFKNLQSTRFSPSFYQFSFSKQNNQSFWHESVSVKITLNVKLMSSFTLNLLSHINMNKRLRDWLGGAWFLGRFGISGWLNSLCLHFNFLDSVSWLSWQVEKKLSCLQLLRNLILEWITRNGWKSYSCRCTVQCRRAGRASTSRWTTLHWGPTLQHCFSSQLWHQFRRPVGRFFLAYNISYLELWIFLS